MSPRLHGTPQTQIPFGNDKKVRILSFFVCHSRRESAFAVAVALASETGRGFSPDIQSTPTIRALAPEVFIKPMTNIFQRWLSALRLGCLAAGMCFLLLSLGLGVHTGLFVRSAASAKGTVTQLTAVQDEDHQITYAPTFEFRAQDGALHSVQPATSSDPAGFTVGEPVPVLYQTSNPANASIATTGQLWGFTLTFGLTGVITLAVGLGLTLNRRRKLNTRLDPTKEINV